VKAFRLPKLFRTSVFQLTLIYVAMFGLSVVAISAFIYWSTVGFLERQTEAIIEADFAGLREQGEQRGALALAETITERITRNPDGRSIYLLTDPLGRPAVGNLSRWPAAETTEPWITFTGRDANDIERQVRAITARVGYGGGRLLVGRDVRELVAINGVFRSAALYGLTLTMGFALAGGVVMGLSAQRRVAEINRTTREIMAGDLSRRAPIRGTRDEHDELAANINAMLDQIETLLTSMRHVGDSVAHDLRGPLTRLRNRLESLAAAEAPSREDLMDCVAQTEGVLDTFNALLRIARVESGAYRSAFATVDLGRIARDVCELYQAAADEHGIELESRLDAHVEVFGDRELLAQALTNLLDNAVKYTPRGGTIAVSLTRTEDTARLSVADSGPGIPAAEHERVLERFTRLDQARSLPGNGLGLALVKAVAAQHHGKLVLGDNAPGLVVAMELPALAALVKNPASEPRPG
jgi:signal transduction histidine kinase